MHIYQTVINTRVPEAGRISECGSYDTETVAIEHESNELDHQSKHHLPHIVCPHITIAH